MKLTPGRLRRLIAEETRNIMEAAAGEDPGERAVRDFYEEITEGDNNFYASFERAKIIFRAYRTATESEPVAETQRSPAMSERLLRSYVRTLLEVLGDDNDFRQSFPNLSRLYKYIDNFPQDGTSGKVFGSIEQYFTNYDEFIKVVSQAIGELGNIWWITGSVDELKEYSEEVDKDIERLSDAYGKLVVNIPEKDIHITPPTTAELRAHGAWRHEIPRGVPSYVPDWMILSPSSMP